MQERTTPLPVSLFSTCPPAVLNEGPSYLAKVIDVARWSEEHGFTGILVVSDNAQMDPWLVAQLIVQNTQQLCPLVAIQPVYMHPYAVAKAIATMGQLYNRRLYLNMVAGGFKNDLNALNDQTPHDRRYDRLVEYTQIIKKLLASHGPVTYAGEFYQVTQLKLSPPLDPALVPGIFISGSSAAGVRAAEDLEAVSIKYPEPASVSDAKPETRNPLQLGVRIGIIARERRDEAWTVAHRRFPHDRKGQLTHQLAMKVSDSEWHRQLSRVDAQGETGRDLYWLEPFQNYKTFCPYLVGSYDAVARELARYVRTGSRTFILDVPAAQEELPHIRIAFTVATELADETSNSLTENCSSGGQTP